MTNGSELFHAGTPNQIIAAYEHLLLRCQQMLVWASAGNWEALIEEEGRYVTEVERLAIVAEVVQLDDDLNERRMDLIERTLELSMEIQRHLVQRRDDLGRMLGGALRQHEADGAGPVVVLPESRAQD